MTISDGMLSCYHAERYCLECDAYCQSSIVIYLERVFATCEVCGHKVETHRIPGTPIATDNG